MNAERNHDIGDSVGLNFRALSAGDYGNDAGIFRNKHRTRRGMFGRFHKFITSIYFISNISKDIATISLNNLVTNKLSFGVYIILYDRFEMK